MQAIYNNINVSGRLHVSGDLTVDGEIKAIQGEAILLGDNFVDLNSGYSTNVAQDGGITVNYLPTTVTDTITSFTAGVASSTNPIIMTSGAATFAANEIISVTSNDIEGNDGLYEVLSHVGNVLTIKGIGVTGTTELFFMNQLNSGTGTGTITKVNIAIIKVDKDSGNWKVSKGSSTPLSWNSLISIDDADLIPGNDGKAVVWDNDTTSFILTDISSAAIYDYGTPYDKAILSSPVGGITTNYQLEGKQIKEILKDMLVQYLSPAFSSFDIASYGTLIEVGDTSINGSKSFTWASSNSTNIQAGSIGITYVNTSTSLASGLNYGDSPYSIALSGLNAANSAPTVYRWRLSGTNTNAIAMSTIDTTVESIHPWFYGKRVSAGGTFTISEIQNLVLNYTTDSPSVVDGTSLIKKVVTTSNGDVTINYGDTTSATQWYWFAIPESQDSNGKRSYYISALNSNNFGPFPSVFADLTSSNGTLSHSVSGTVKFSGVNYFIYIAQATTSFGTVIMKNTTV